MMTAKKKQKPAKERPRTHFNFRFDATFHEALKLGSRLAGETMTTFIRQATIERLERLKKQALTNPVIKARLNLMKAEDAEK